MEIIVLAALTATSTVILLVKFIGWNMTLEYHRIVDIVVTIGMAYLFRGTFSGMATAIIAGVMLSLALGAIKAARDYGTHK